MKRIGIILSCIIFLLAGLNEQARSGGRTMDSNNLRDEKNVFKASAHLLGEKIYPQFSIEGDSVDRSGWGIWGSGEHSQPVVYQKWIEKGYNLNKRFGVNGKLAISYSFNSYYLGKVKLFAGANLDLGKLYFGPLLGIHINKERWSLRAMGVYSLATAYKSEYPEGSQRYNHSNPVFIRGFDPNSWYKFSFSYSLNKSFRMGVISERFYASGLFIEHDLRVNSQQLLQNLRLRVALGRNFESKQNCFSAGVAMDLM